VGNGLGLVRSARIYRSSHPVCLVSVRLTPACLPSCKTATVNRQSMQGTMQHAM
jgi:hypothetical protein